jgi:hypothetical protein
MVDENKFWDQVLALGIFLFGVYLFSKDLIDEGIIPYLVSKTLSALILACGVCVAIIKYNSYLLKKDIEKRQRILKERERI